MVKAARSRMAVRKLKRSVWGRETLRGTGRRTRHWRTETMGRPGIFAGLVLRQKRRGGPDIVR